MTVASHLLKDPTEHKASLEAGKAWKWLKRANQRTLPEWLKIGSGFQVGRAWAMRRSGTNQPSGRGYNEAFSQWLAAYDMADVDQGDRSNLFKLMETPEALAWRNGLPDAQRNKLNHPTTVLRAYRRHQERQEPSAQDAAALRSLRAKPALTGAEIKEQHDDNHSGAKTFDDWCGEVLIKVTAAYASFGTETERQSFAAAIRGALEELESEPELQPVAHATPSTTRIMSDQDAADVFSGVLDG